MSAICFNCWTVFSLDGTIQHHLFLVIIIITKKRRTQREKGIVMRKPAEAIKAE